MSSPTPNLMTPGEYLELERKSEIRSEYIAGPMFAMSGASLRHGLMAGNLFREISSQMRGRACEAHTNGLRVKVSPTGMSRILTSSPSAARLGSKTSTSTRFSIRQ
jgi:Uma2 family endonuclease